MIIAFYPVSNPRNYGRHTFDEVTEFNTLKILMELNYEFSEIRKDEEEDETDYTDRRDEVHFYEIDKHGQDTKFNSASDLERDYNDEFLDGGLFCVLLPNMTSDDMCRAIEETEKFSSEEWHRIAKELCDGLDNDIDEVSDRLKEYGRYFCVPQDRIEDMCWEDSSDMFGKIYDQATMYDWNICEYRPFMPKSQVHEMYKKHNTFAVRPTASF